MQVGRSQSNSQSNVPVKSSSPQSNLPRPFYLTDSHHRIPLLLFDTDVHTGDTTCMSCGCVCEEHHIDMGQAKRSFEDKPDQGHHGPSPNPLMPDSWNTRTSLSKLKQGGPGSVAVVDPGDAPPHPSPPSQCQYLLLPDSPGLLSCLSHFIPYSFLLSLLLIRVQALGRHS